MSLFHVDEVGPSSWEIEEYREAPPFGRKRYARDPLAKRRAIARRTHCSQGHELTPENVYKMLSGSTICRTCKLDYERNRRKKA